jgi:hypothetical protein
MDATPSKAKIPSVEIGAVVFAVLVAITLDT